MQKAYDVKELGKYVLEEAKKEGLDPEFLKILEEKIEALGLSIYKGSKQWLKDSAVLSKTKIDDWVSPFYDKLDPHVEGAIKKLDLNKDGQ